MKYFSLLLLVVLFNSVNGFSQEKVIKHTVSKGETISEIADKYNIKASTIYALNPKAKKGIKFHTVLSIPIESKKKPISTTVVINNYSENTHEVLAKETLYGIARQYYVSINDLYKINPNLEKEGLKQGEKINVPQVDSANLALTSMPKKEVQKTTIPEKNISKKELVVLPKPTEKVEISQEEITHEVLPKETLYSIVKKFKITIADLQNANPTLEIGILKAGEKIIIPINKANRLGFTADEKLIKSKNELSNSVQINQNAVLQNNVVETEKIESDITHEVLPKETLFSIAREYGIKLADLKKANSTLENKALKVGQKINVPAKADSNSSLAVVGIKSLKTGKTLTPSEEERQAAILALPVIENKTVESVATHRVLAKETKYGIANEYGITVEELEKQNPKIVKELLIGYKLKIRSSKLNKNAVNQEVVDKGQVVKTDSDKIVNATATEHDETFVDKLISTASENIGTRYRSGGMTKGGFDCSGLMCSTFGAYNIQLPRSSMEMSSYGVRVNTENAQKGDLIFFKTRGGQRINHVGMVVEVIDGDIKFIHSSSGGGVMISSIKEKYYDKNFVQINHVL